MRRTPRRRSRARALALAALLGPAGAAGLAGCGDVFEPLLEVKTPSRIPAEQMEDPANAALLVSAAVGELECGLARYILIGGAIGNELRDAQQTGGTGMWEMDRRRMPASGIYGTNTCDAPLPGAYVPLSTSRWLADNVLAKLENDWTDQQVASRTRLIATAAAYSGYALLLLGEGFCSAAVDAGPELGKAELFRLAEQRFTRALAAAEAAGDASVLNMARVGRARARLDLGRKAEAAADARLVPAGFVRNAQYGLAPTRVENRVFSMNNRDRQYTIEEIYRDLRFAGVRDPRVTVVNANAAGNDRSTPIWEQRKYASETAPIPIARHAEARLIVAEAEGGQTAVEIINELHARAGLPAFRSTDPAEIMAQVVEERKRELFLEGHHLYDLVRYGIPLYPAPGQPYQLKGGTYGTETCVPLPDAERHNNPNIRG